MKTNWSTYQHGCLLLLSLTLLGSPLRSQTMPRTNSSSDRVGTNAPEVVISSVGILRGSEQTSVRVEGSGRLTYHAARTTNPDRVVLDFSGARLGVKKPANPDVAGPVRSIRMEQYKPDIARVVIDLSTEAPYRILTDGKAVVVLFEGSAEKTPASGSISTAAKAAEAASANVSQPTDPTNPQINPKQLVQPPSATEQAAPTDTPELATEQPHDRYRIGPGDVLQISIYDQAQLSRDGVRVDGSGLVNMPFIEGDIKAVCKSETELARNIAEEYRTFLKNPQVSVSIKEYSSQPVAVVGAVLKPGSFQLARPVRLRELLSYAGGPSPSSGRVLQIVHDESVPDCVQQTPKPAKDLVMYSLADVMNGLPDANPYLRAGDVVNLPEAEQIYVVGNVPKPSAFLLKDEPITVSRAIAMAGGALPNSKSYARILRQTPGKPGNTEILVKLSATRLPGEADITLQAGDVVDVPLAQGKIIFKYIFTSVATGALLYYPLTLINK